MFEIFVIFQILLTININISFNKAISFIPYFGIKSFTIIVSIIELIIFLTISLFSISYVKDNHQMFI
ncbi:MAG: hypothetical protein LBD88_04655 [Candidatus Peribacteria bacterium]|nr:hypothetical protein [Candidatus Peribacteria bacterium]